MQFKVIKETDEKQFERVVEAYLHYGFTLQQTYIQEKREDGGSYLVYVAFLVSNNSFNTKEDIENLLNSAWFKKD